MPGSKSVPTPGRKSKTPGQLQDPARAGAGAAAAHNAAVAAVQCHTGRHFWCLSSAWRLALHRRCRGSRRDNAAVAAAQRDSITSI